MMRLLQIVLLLLFTIAPSYGQAPPATALTSYNLAVTTTPVQIWPAASSFREFSRIINAGPTSGGYVSCSRELTATSSPVLAANIAGTFTLGPAGNAANLPYYEQFNYPNFVPTGALWCVALSGTVQVTAETAP